jgi:hypothetical protein
MTVYSTNHQLLNIPAIALDRSSTEDPLQALVNQVFIKCNKQVTRCPSVYFFATITHEMFEQLCRDNDRALLLQRCYALFSAKIAASNPLHLEQEPQPLLSFSQKYSIGLSKEKLNQFQQTLASLIKDENFMQGRALSQNGLAATNQILFTFSLHHENIDTKFIEGILKKNKVLHEKEIIHEIVKACTTSFSSRTGFTQEKA